MGGKHAIPGLDGPRVYLIIKCTPESVRSLRRLTAESGFDGEMRVNFCHEARLGDFLSVEFFPLK